MKNNSKISFNGGVRKLEMREMVEESWGRERKRTHGREMKERESSRRR